MELGGRKKCMAAKPSCFTRSWLQNIKFLAIVFTFPALCCFAGGIKKSPGFGVFLAALPLLQTERKLWRNRVDELSEALDATAIISMKWRAQFVVSDKTFIASMLHNGFEKSWEDAVAVWFGMKNALVQKNVQEADTHIRRLYSLFETDCTQLNMAAMHLENHQPDSALKILEFAADTAKQFWEYQFNKSLAYSDLGRYREALFYLQKLVPMEQENVKIAFGFAKIYQHLGHYFKAGEYLELTSRLAPNYSPCWFLLGITQSKLGRLQEAFLSFDRAAKIRPGNFGLWYNKGNVLLRLGKYENALSCFQHALGLNPGYAMAWNNLGIVFTRLGRSFKALQSFRRALSFQPRLAEANLNCGLIFESMGNPQKALEYYTRFLQIASEDFSQQKKAITVRIGKIKNAGHRSGGV